MNKTKNDEGVKIWHQEADIKIKSYFDYNSGSSIIYFGIVYGYFYSKTSKMKRTTISRKASDLGITKETEDKLDKFSGITNIALFGLDSRVKNEASRSDCIMIITLDGTHNKIKISSIMRDTYVHVDGYGMTKITHAYAYGGPQLAIKTINENFGLNIKDYVKVDFFSLEKIVDSVGGIEVNITSQELKVINGYIKEVSDIEKHLLRILPILVLSF